ncbi:MAG: hypothetical protein ACYS67_18835 [Planctomycetota bacterium]|jgi:hypothetical protein
MPDQPGQQLHPQSPGKRAKASLILFAIAAAIVLLDIIGPIILSSGHDIISSRLHDRLAFLALLSVPFIPILLVVGSVLAILEWRAERRTSGRANRMTVLAACLNLVSLIIAALLILVALLFLFGPQTDLTGW